MKRVLLLIITAFTWFIISAQTVEYKLDSVLQKRAGKFEFNGSVLVAQNGKLLLSKGYGYNNKEKNILHTENSIFQIGSITKQFTAVAILKLQEEGKLSVNDKLSKYYPDFPNAGRITIANLLNHTSGIYNYTNDKGFMMNKVAIPHTENEILALFRDKPLEFEPGSKFAYSNSGYSLLGYIIQKAAGKPYEQVIREYIFTPLGMTSSGFDFTHLKSPGKSTGYFLIKADTSTPAIIVDSTVAYSAGAIYSTVTDLFKWDRAIGSPRLLKPQSWKAAFTPFQNNYGFGWVIDTVYNKQVLTHSGGIHGFTSNMTKFPKEDVVIILLNNAGTGHLSVITQELAGLVFNIKPDLPVERKEISLTPDVLKQYVGDYSLTPQFIIKVSLDDNQLKGQATGQPAFDLFPETETKFFLKAVKAEIEFIKDSAGKVEKLILYQGGQKIEGKKN